MQISVPGQLNSDSTQFPTRDDSSDSDLIGLLETTGYNRIFKFRAGYSGTSAFKEISICPTTHLEINREVNKEIRLDLSAPTSPIMKST